MLPVRRLPILLLLSGVAWLAGCAATQTKAPVEVRQPVRQGARAPLPPPAATTPPVSVPADGAKVLPGTENAGKPGYYTVKPGDTMIRIGLEQGQNWRDIVRWNGIENPNLIEVGQVLRVTPPGAEAPSVAVARPVTSSSVAPAAPASAPAPAAVAAPAPPAAAAPVAAGDEEPAFIWPSGGALLTGFDEVKNKGLDLGGKAGDPVLAAADGRVVYAGSGLRGYGNLVIIKHNATYLTAYAHNQSLLVKDEQVVRRGQKIAEMGSSDADRVQLHFEIRRLGVPIDPMRLLPPR